jgi:hypothetical protein
MTIIECLRDPNLFGRFFKGKSWKAWRSFLATLFAEPARDDEIALYRACTGRTAWPTLAFTEAAVVVGRRGGKSRILALIAVYLATMRDYSTYLAPGEVATIAVLAADRSQARVIFRFVSGLLKAVPLMRPMIIGGTPRRSRSRIVFTSRSPLRVFARRAAIRLRRFYATRLPSGDRTRARPIPMSRSCGRCVRASLRYRDRCC